MIPKSNQLAGWRGWGIAVAVASVALSSLQYTVIVSLPTRTHRVTVVGDVVDLFWTWTGALQRFE